MRKGSSLNVKEKERERETVSQDCGDIKHPQAIPQPESSHREDTTCLLCHKLVLPFRWGSDVGVLLGEDQEYKCLEPLTGKTGGLLHEHKVVSCEAHFF